MSQPGHSEMESSEQESRLIDPSRMDTTRQAISEVIVKPEIPSQSEMPSRIKTNAV
jgi:hypothetical protein